MTPSRKRAGIWPLPLPPVEVATSLPAAERSDALAPTALLPSTAPALLGEVDRRDGGARQGDDERDDGDDHGGGWQAKLHDGLLRRGSAGPYFRANPARAAEVRPAAPVVGDKAYPRPHGARMGARPARWEPGWHADHAHPHRSRQGQHARPPLSSVALLMEGHLQLGGHRTWYRVVGDLDASAQRAPVIICHGGPGATHDYVAPIAEQLRSDGPGLRPLRPARQRPLGPPARRRPVVLDGRAVRARARGPRRPPRHRRALPRRRPVVGRHARPAARARAPGRAAERGRGRLAVVDPRPSSRAATSCSTRWTPP